MQSMKTFIAAICPRHKINRPGVAEAVLLTALSLNDIVTHGFWKYLYGAATPQRLEMVLSVIK